MAATVRSLGAQTMTLHDCLVYARDHAHANVIATQSTEQARYDARMAQSELLPYIALSGNGNISLGRNIDPETNTYDNKKTLSTAFGLSMSLPLFDGLVNVNNLRAARAAVRGRRAAAEAERDRVSLDVIKAFYNVSYCRAMVGQMEEQLRRDNGNLRSAERGEALGTRSGADVAEMRALVAGDEFELTNQRGLLGKAWLALRGAMGMELTADTLHLVEEPYSGAGAGDAAWENPRVAEARESLAGCRYSLRAARGQWSPRLSLSAGISTSYYKMIGSDVVAPDFSRQWHDNMGQYVGLSLTIPLFDGLSTFNRVRRARAAMRESRARLEQARYEADREAAEAALDLAASIDGHKAAQARYDAELMAYNATERRYELGAASALDLYTSAAKLATARADLEGKRIQAAIDRIVNDYHHGIPLIRM